MHTTNSDDASLLFATAENDVLTTHMYIASNGEIGIGNTNPLNQLDVNGDIRTRTGCVRGAGGVTIAGTCSSDKRLKKNVKPLGNALEKVAQLEAMKLRVEFRSIP